MSIGFFIPSIAATLVVLATMYIWGGLAALFATLILSVLEVTLSFDNAVINAKILKNMSPKWQRRFLTWGILIAVFGTRLVLPVLIVAASTMTSPLSVMSLAFSDSVQYGKLLHDAHYVISSFGGMFLLMVSLKYFVDSAKSVHWIRVIERKLAAWGRVEAIEIVFALILLLAFALLVPQHSLEILIAGIIGLILFILIQGLANAFAHDGAEIAKSGAMLFVYLNIIDSAFSLDGVVGAFAISSSLPVIIAGLGIGAYFVRTFTVYMVRHKMLDTLVYLEHGAHWAIFALAVAMFSALVIEVPEVITGIAGLVFVIASYFSSKKIHRN